MRERIQNDPTVLFLWGRRAAATLIAALFLPILIIAVNVSALQSAMATPDDLLTALDDADFYGYTHDHLIPTLLDEFFEEADHAVVRAAEPWSEDIAQSARIAFPLEDIREETEILLRAVWPYLRGDEDEFEVTIPLAPVVGRWFDVFSQQVARGNDDVYASLTHLAQERVVDEAVAYGLPADSLDAIDDVAESHIPLIAPSDWLFPQLAQAVEDGGAYYIGETENPEITIPIDARADEIRDAITDSLNEVDLGDEVARAALVTELDASIEGAALFVPSLGDVDGELVADFLLDAIPAEELRRVEMLVINDVSLYAVGQSDDLVQSDVELSMEQAAVNASNAVALEAGRRFAAAFNSLIVCQPGTPQIQTSLQTIGDILPRCRIDSAVGDVYRDTVRAFAEEIVRVETRRIIPSTVEISADTIEGSLDEDVVAAIEQIREVVTQGIMGDAANLTAQVSDELYGDPGELRETIISGIVISEQTLEGSVADGDEPAIQAIRTFASFSALAQYALWAVAGLVLLLLAFVGGRGWEGRLTWASIVLGVGAALTWLIAASSMELIIRPALEGWSTALVESYTDSASTELLLRLETFVASFLESLSERVQSQAIRVGVIAAVVLVIARLLAPESVGRRPGGR